MKSKVLRIALVPIVFFAGVVGPAAANAAALDVGVPDRVVNNPAVRVANFTTEPRSNLALSVGPVASHVNPGTIGLAQPSITIDIQHGVFEVSGQNFTSGGKVELQVLSNVGLDAALLTEELTAASTPVCHTPRDCARAAAPGSIRFVTTTDFLQNLPCDTRVDVVAVDQSTDASDLSTLYWCPGVTN